MKLFEWLSNLFVTGDMMLANALDFINRLVENAAFSGLNLFVQVIPWSVSAIPAYFTYVHVRWALDYPDTVPEEARRMMGLLSGWNIEGLGIVSMFIAVSLLAHNQQVKRRLAATRLAADRKVIEVEKLSWTVFLIPASIILFYVAIVIGINVGLQYSADNFTAQLVAHTFLSLLTIPGAIVTSGWQYLQGRLGGFGQTDTGQMVSTSDTSDISSVDFRTFRQQLSDEDLLEMSRCASGPALSDLLASKYEVQTSKPARWLSTNIPKELQERGL